eukprot:2190311-Rhodomonas_salina.1
MSVPDSAKHARRTVAIYTEGRHSTRVGGCALPLASAPIEMMFLTVSARQHHMRGRLVKALCQYRTAHSTGVGLCYRSMSALQRRSSNGNSSSPVVSAGCCGAIAEAATCCCLQR